MCCFHYKRCRSIVQLINIFSQFFPNFVSCVKCDLGFRGEKLSIITKKVTIILYI